MTTGTMIVPAAIRAYRRSRTVRAAVRLGVGVHHRLRPRQARGPCPLAGACSATALADARATGWAALWAALARMAVCGPGLVDETLHCRPASSVEEHCQSWI